MTCPEGPTDRGLATGQGSVALDFDQTAAGQLSDLTPAGRTTDSTPARRAISPTPAKRAMSQLLDGHRRFRADIWPERRVAYELLAEAGQSPVAAVIACADSRVDPSAIFGAAPGQLFVLRNVANLVPPYQPDAAYHGTSAGLEFAVKSLQVPIIVVLGHHQCGGVRALMQGGAGSLNDFVLPWMEIAARARGRVLACDLPEADQLTACEHETVKVALENLMSFPWIADPVRAGELLLMGAYYGIATGLLELLGPDGSFAAFA